MKRKAFPQPVGALFSSRNTTTRLVGLLLFFLLSGAPYLQAQEEEEATDRPVSDIFGSQLLIDNQTALVPIKGTFEFDIMHRFGTLQNGFDDLYGLYANSNIRLGLSYVAVNHLQLGLGLTKFKNILDLNAKYAIFEQTRSGKVPLSLTYYGNIGIDTRNKEDREEIYNKSDRYSYFHQLLIARKFANWFSFQIAPSLSHYNIIEKDMNNDHIALAFGAQFQVTGVTSIIVGVDQPLTKHKTNNPNPNVSMGIQLRSSSHAFQIFLSNYNMIVPQENNVFNDHNWVDGFKENFLIGFNITRLWNF